VLQRAGEIHCAGGRGGRRGAGLLPGAPVSVRGVV
jgi:hypothetical protein